MIDQLREQITQENVNKILDRLEKAGRILDRKTCQQIFMTYYKDQMLPANSVTELCDDYISDIWNMGGIIQ